MRILVIEDDDVLRMVWRTSFQYAGHDVVDCASCKSAGKWLKPSGFDLIVTDLMLGDGDVLTLLAQANLMSPPPPVIIITGTEHFPYGELFQFYPSLSWVLRKPTPVPDLLALAEYAERRTGCNHDGMIP